MESARKRRRSHYFVLMPLTLGALVLAGCVYNYKVAIPGRAPASTPVPHTMWSFVWGIVNGNPVPSEDITCMGPAAFHSVTVKHKPLYDVITVVTLGIASPRIVEWECAAPEPSQGTIPSLDN